MLLSCIVILTLSVAKGKDLKMRCLSHLEILRQSEPALSEREARVEWAAQDDETSPTRRMKFPTSSGS